MSAYYNEFKPEAAHMLRQLIKDGLIAPGEVDERSITEVSSDDIKGFTQAHWFAGIGGWSVALRLAGWDDTRPVWTGSCPCQPFSSAGKQKGKADERHLWPVWAKLIRESRPVRIYGEQVASAIAYGWWDDVADDLEAENYAVGAAVLPACSIGRPHRRDRLWFVADCNGGRRDAASLNQEHGKKYYVEPRGAMANSPNIISDERGCGDDSGSRRANQGPIGANGGLCDVADTQRGGRQGQRALGESEHPATGCDGQADKPVDGSARLQWLHCPDGKQRPVEPSIRLLAHGVQHRASLLHGYGNAIVPQVAAEFIKATGV